MSRASLRGSSRIARLGVALLLAAGTTARAQDPVLPRTLSLADAMRLAERGNPNFRRYVNDVDVSEAQRRQARAGYLPTLSASMSFDGSGTQTATGLDDFGNPIREETRTIRSSSARQGVSLGMTLFDGGTRERRIAAAQQQVAAAEATVGAQRVTLRTQVATQYFRAVDAAGRIALEERLLADAREQYDATQRRFGISAARREDLLGSEADVANAEARVEQARGAARKAELALREQLGLDPGAPVVLTDSIPRTGVGVALSADSLVDVALGANRQLAAADARAEAAARSAAAARGGRWPRISASAGYSRSDQSRDYGSFFDVNPGGARGFTFGLSSTLPLFDAFQVGTQVATADAQAEDARLDVRIERLRIEQEVRSAVIDVENARRALQLAERAAELSRERIALTQERYQAGGVDFLNLQSALTQAASAERELMNARLQLATAWVQLEGTIGVP